MKRSRRPRKCSTATSLAAFSTAGATPPSPTASKAAPSGEGETEAPSGLDEAAEQEALRRAREAVGKLKATLKGRLQVAMKEGGPIAAIQVCASEAQKLTDQVAREAGVKVGRASLRLRNPANAGPPWVRKWLQAQGERSAEGVRGFERIEWGEARVLQPLAVGPLCLNCHGAPEQLDPKVREVLAERYPEDRATGYRPGDMMLISDHIYLPGMAGNNPLMGPNDDSLGPRFPDMSHAYDPHLREMARRIAQEENLPLHEGVYASVAGPSFETPAEVRFLRIIGADAVGMSTAPETVVAVHSGMKVLGISGISNAAPGVLPSETTHEEVLAAGKVLVPRMITLLHRLVPTIAGELDK